MPLTPGAKLGPYELIAPLGEGGMGEVWKARDPRLDRLVAIKTSKRQFSERFDREARAVAALNHPNICQIYDVGPDYLVMELIDGEPIKGPLSEEKAIEHAAQILDALDAAHKKNIIHRDLKPANILVTKQGIKLLDFGLAKHSGGQLRSTDETLTKALTGAGEIVGTLQYMSPEQLQAKDADVRSDIFSFGCVLYELLTGKRAFNGDSAASVIAAILEREPAPIQTSEALTRALKRCLAKDPDDRFQSARDLKYNLTLTTPPAKPYKQNRWLVAALATAIPACAVAAWLLKPTPEQPVLHVDINPPEGHRFLPGRPALSPDGKRIAFRARKGSAPPAIWVRDLATGVSSKVPNTEQSSLGVWTPDSAALTYRRGNQVFKDRLNGTPPTVVCDGECDWLNFDFAGIAYVLDKDHLFRVELDGVKRTPVAPHLEITRGPYAFLPGNRHVVYDFSSDQMLGFLDGSPSRKLFTNIESPTRFALTPGAAWLTYEAGSIPFARALDLKTLQLAPEAVAVAGPTGLSTSYSNSGVVALRHLDERPSQLTWFDRGGKTLGTVGEPLRIRSFDYSVPSNRVIVREDVAAGNMYLHDLKSGAVTRTGRGSTPRFSQDGNRIYYRSIPELDLVEDSPTGGRRKVLVPQGVDGSPKSAGDTTPDGKWILSSQQYVSLVDPSRRIPDRNDSTLTIARISPNGKWLARFRAETNGATEIFIEALPSEITRKPAPEGRVAVAATRGTYAGWRSDGKELYFLSRTLEITAVSIEETEALPRIGPPRALFPLPSTSSTLKIINTPDGQRFLIPVPVGEAVDPPITLNKNRRSPGYAGEAAEV